METSLTIRQNIPLKVALEPVSNTLNSFSLLNKAEQLTSLSTWVTETAVALTPEQRFTNWIVLEGLRDVLTPLWDEPNFPSYLHNLSEFNPYLLCKRVLEPLRRRFSRRVSSATPQAKHLLNDLQTFLDCVRRVQGDDRFDSELQTEVHKLLQNPSEMQRLITTHLEFMWKTTYGAEWRRVQSSLRGQVEMFTRSLNEEASLEETFHEFTGRPLPPTILHIPEDTAEILLIPSWHNGRNVTTWDGAAWDGETTWGGKETLRLFFSEPPNYDVATLRDTPVQRAELRARMGALADDTRLHIIELLTQHNELQAQDIIADLDLGQSSVSRHLKQLVSMGYLYERRGDGANKTYRLSSFYFERTARALQQFIATESAVPNKPIPQSAPYPQDLKRFVDSEGRLTIWPPSKQGDKLLILKYLASFFTIGRTYSEKEVNHLLRQHSTTNDPAALRRGLCEYRFMDRKQDGSLYWLNDE